MARSYYIIPHFIRGALSPAFPHSKTLNLSGIGRNADVPKHSIMYMFQTLVRPIYSSIVIFFFLMTSISFTHIPRQGIFYRSF